MHELAAPHIARQGSDIIGKHPGGKEEEFSFVTAFAVPARTHMLSVVLGRHVENGLPLAFRVVDLVAVDPLRRT